jgi:hypothetical protein
VNSKVFIPHIVDEEIQGYKSCGDFDLNRMHTTYYSSLDLGISTSTSATGIGSVGNTLFLSFDSSSTTDPDFGVYRIDGDMLQKISALDTGPGIVDMKIIGLTAFLANTSVHSQVQAIDISNELNPILIHTYTIPGSNSVISPISKKIFVYKSTVFVGTEKSVLPELYSFDIQTTQPLGYINTDYGINGMFVRDQKLYILSPKDPELEIFDISTSSQFTKSSFFDAPQSLGNGRSLSSSGPHIFLGRSKGDDELYDISNLVHQHIGASVDHIQSTLNNIYTFTSLLEKRILSFNISTTSLTQTGVLSVPERINSVLCVNDGMFLTLQSTTTPLARLTILK